jgi:hypothetical protein
VQVLMRMDYVVINSNKPSISRHKQVTSWRTQGPQSFQHIWSHDKPIIHILYYFNTGVKYQESVEILSSLTESMWYESKEGPSQP